MHKQVVILAAGKGSRMGSDKPKPLHLVKDEPMLDRVVNAALNVTPDVVLVHSDALVPYLSRYDKCLPVLQQERFGTAHAVFCALEKIKKDSFVTIVYADHPFIDTIIIDKMFSQINDTEYCSMTLASIQEGENAYGRIILNGQEITKIVEFRNLSEEQKQIKLCNSALMVFRPGVLHEFLPKLMERKIQDQAEYYLTGIVDTINTNGGKVSYVLDDDSKYSFGVNTQQELQEANQSNF